MLLLPENGIEESLVLAIVNSAKNYLKKPFRNMKNLKSLIQINRTNLQQKKLWLFRTQNSHKHGCKGR